MRATLTTKGNWTRTYRYLLKDRKKTRRSILEEYALIGIQKLERATPKDTGLTANSWYYEIVDDDKKTTVHFCNSNVNDGVPIAIVLQYGHATGSGGWVEGVNYINPALSDVFKSIADSMWKEVTRD